jgi:hypothetical protein
VRRSLRCLGRRSVPSSRRPRSPPSPYPFHARQTSSRGDALELELDGAPEEDDCTPARAMRLHAWSRGSSLAPACDAVATRASTTPAMARASSLAPRRSMPAPLSRPSLCPNYQKYFEDELQAIVDAPRRRPTMASAALATTLASSSSRATSSSRASSSFNSGTPSPRPRGRRSPTTTHRVTRRQCAAASSGRDDDDDSTLWCADGDEPNSVPLASHRPAVRSHRGRRRGGRRPPRAPLPSLAHPYSSRTAR